LQRANINGSNMFLGFLIKNVFVNFV